MYFGNYAMLEPIEYQLQKNPEWSWFIKPPTSGDELALARFINQGRVTISPEGTTRDAPPSWLEIAYREIAMTFGGTTIPKSLEDETPVLAEDAKLTTVEAVLKAMPHPLVMELWEAVRTHVPGWGPRAVEEEEDPKAES
jgi:hypothetical protein